MLFDFGDKRVVAKKVLPTLTMTPLDILTAGKLKETLQSVPLYMESFFEITCNMGDWRSGRKDFVINLQQERRQRPFKLGSRRAS